VDLPSHAHTYSNGISSDVSLPCQCELVPTAYSVLACVMGYTSLKAFSRALERRVKPPYAVLVLDVCVAILTLRNDLDERRKLQRELCVVSVRQGDHNTSSTYCKQVLKTLCQHLELRGKNSSANPEHQNPDYVALKDTHEFLFTTDLLVTQYANASEFECMQSALQEMNTRLGQRHRLCMTSVASREVEAAIQQAAVFAACIFVAQSELTSASNSLQRALASEPTSVRRRIAILSHLVEVESLGGKPTNAHVNLRRIERFRQRQNDFTSHEISLNILESQSSCLLWDLPVKGKLISLCDENVDLGKLGAQIALLDGQPKRAWRILAPTIAAVEAAVSHIGSVQGLSELGALYELRGHAQVAMAKDLEQTDFPLCIDDDRNANCRRDQCIVSDTPATGKERPSHIVDDMSHRPRSRHYRSYCNAADVRIDASRWYRHALECFRAVDDHFGVACAASAFASTSLNTIFPEIALTTKAPNSRLLAGKISIQEVDLAAHYALELAGVMNEPLLLLHAYLNIAELRYVQADSLNAIAHWWEARDILLRLFVIEISVPIVAVVDSVILTQLRQILERLLRFLAAVADKAMIDENAILFEIFLFLERDGRCKNAQLDTQDVKNNPNSTDIYDSRSCWHCLLRVHANVSRHRKGTLNLKELQDRNRMALRELAAIMRHLRSCSTHIQTSRQTTPTAYAVHAINSLIIYAPYLSWCHALTFGRFDRGLDDASVSLIGAFVGARRVLTKRNGIDHRRSVIKRIAHAIALPPKFFSSLTPPGDAEGPFITLHCSERAQVLPWECLADTAITRTLHTSDAVKHCVSIPVCTGQELSNKCTSCWSGRMSVEVALSDAVTEARSIVESLVHDLARPSTCSDAYQKCLKIYVCGRQSANGPRHVLHTMSFCALLPLSLFYALDHFLLQIQARYAELIFAPDDVVSHMRARVEVHNSARINILAKAISDELAVPIVHSLIRVAGSQACD